MNKIPTAAEFRKQLLKEKGRITENELMIEFAKLHVTALIRAALDYEIDGCGCGESLIISEHIKTCYPLENIK